MSLVADSFANLIVSGKEPDAETLRKLNVFDDDNTLGLILQSVRTAHSQARQEVENRLKLYAEEAKIHKSEPNAQQVKILNDYKVTRVKLASLKQLKECRQQLKQLQEKVDQLQTQEALESYEALINSIETMDQYSDVKIVRALKSEADNLLEKIKQGQLHKWSQAVAVQGRQLRVGEDAQKEYKLLGLISNEFQSQAVDQLVKDLHGLFDGVLDQQRAVIEFSDSVNSLVAEVSSLPESVASSVTKRLATPVTNKLLQNLPMLIPDSVDELGEFEAHLDVLKKVEENLAKSGWLQSGDEISDWLCTLPEVWLSKRRDCYMSKLRSKLLSGVSKTVLKTTKPSIKKSQSRASLAPSEGSDKWGDELDFSDDDNNEDWGWGDEPEAGGTEVTELVGTNLPSILIDSVSSFLEEGTKVYERRKEIQTCRAGFMYPSDTINFYVLFRALIPIAYGSVSSPDSVFPLALYNDIDVICAHMKTQEQDAQLDSEIELMQKFAKRHLQQVVSQHRTPVVEIIRGAGGFRDCSHEGGNLFNCQVASEKLTSYLTQVSEEWTGKVSDDVRMQMLGTLLNYAAVTIITQVENLGDISEAESIELAKLITVISESTEPLFGDALAAAFCPSWLKFQYLGQILQSNLADIRYMLESGTLVDYSAVELVALVEALFSDSDRRRKLISDVLVSAH